MYRILLADDEGIMLSSMKSMIETNFGEKCEIATAKTGRSVVELAEDFHPDIVFMDIHMPGINGLDAIRQIQEKQKQIVFIVITAYDKFDYAKDAISLGTYEFLTKPVKKQVFIDVLSRAMLQVDSEKKSKIDNMRIKEKLETVLPIIESGYINDVLLQEGVGTETSYYLELMDFKAPNGIVLIFQFGESMEHDVLTNSVGTSMRLHKFYMEIRSLIKQYYSALVGPIMSNKIIIVIPSEYIDVLYEERIRMIELTRNLLKSLEDLTDAKFKAGIGRPKPMEQIKESYHEAFRAVKEGKGHVAHVADYPIGCGYEQDYPVEIEKLLFLSVERCDKNGAIEYGTAFFDWMIAAHGSDIDNIRLKVLEFVMRAEQSAFLNGGMSYSFNYRKNYLTSVLGMEEMEQLRQWFVDKLCEVCHNMTTKKEEQSISLINQSKTFIQEHFDREISLDEISRMVNISPYYFSKLFKEETGENFIDYLTGIRIEHAKQLLRDPAISVKEVCIASGYSDPNYFSRIFKKKESITPTEFRERG